MQRLGATGEYEMVLHEGRNEEDEKQKEISNGTQRKKWGRRVKEGMGRGRNLPTFWEMRARKGESRRKQESEISE